MKHKGDEIKTTSLSNRILSTDLIPEQGTLNDAFKKSKKRGGEVKLILKCDIPDIIGSANDKMICRLDVL